MLIDYSIDNSTLSEAQKNIRREVALNRLNKMQEYARLYRKDSKTLQDFILRYFNEYDPRSELSDRTDLDPDPDGIDALFSNRTRVAQELRKGNMSGTLEVGLSDHKRRAHGESDKKAQKKLTVDYRVTGAELDYFDMMVFDAVCTLIRERVPIIFPRTVMELLAGDRNLRLQSDRKEAVENSIHKMMNANIVIDRSGSADYGFEYPHQKEKNTKVLGGAFLPLDKKVAGFGYEVKNPPPLYEYAQILNGQFYTLPFTHLHVGKFTSRDKIADYHVSEDEYMERRIRIYKFIPSENAEAKDLYIPPTPENPGRPENPQLPAQFQTSVENLEILHYLLQRIDMIKTFPQKQKPLRARTRSIIRFDTMIKTLRLDLQGKKSKTVKTEEQYYKRRRADSLWKWTVMILEHLQASGVIEKYELLVKYPDKKKK